MPWTRRPLCVVTGAAGGIGLATSRLLGMTHDLVLADIEKGRLETVRASLTTDGAEVANLVWGRLEDPDFIDRLAAALPRGRCVDVLVHAAGLASVQGDWYASVMTNVVGTRRLMAMIAGRMNEGGAAVLLSSLAGHADVPLTEADRIIEQWEAPDLLARLEPSMQALPEGDRSGRCYVIAKRMILRLCETLALEWAAHGIRINSISPGLVDTPMGRQEAAESPAARDLAAKIPLGAMMKPIDIAAAIGFLVSPWARNITGTDLKIDGGLQAALTHARGNPLDPSLVRAIKAL